MATAVAACAGAIAGVGTVGAAADDPLVLTNGSAHHLEGAIGPLPQPLDTIDPALRPAPATCESAQWCDVIPVRVDDTGVTEDDDYLIEFILRWESPDIDNPVSLLVQGERFAVHDLDLYVYHDPVIDGFGPEQDGAISAGNGFARPERAYLSRTSGDFQVMILGYLAVGRVPYQLDIRWIPGIFPEPFELLAPPVTTPPTAAALLPAVPTELVAAEPSRPAPRRAPAAVGRPAAALAPAPIDDAEEAYRAFVADDGASTPEPTGLLAAAPPGRGDLGATPELAAPSAMSVAWSLGLLPLLGLATLGVAHRRSRSPSAPVAALPTTGDAGGSPVSPEPW